MFRVSKPGIIDSDFMPPREILAHFRIPISGEHESAILGADFR